MYTLSDRTRLDSAIVVFNLFLFFTALCWPGTEPFEDCLRGPFSGQKTYIVKLSHFLTRFNFDLELSFRPPANQTLDWMFDSKRDQS